MGGKTDQYKDGYMVSYHHLQHRVRLKIENGYEIMNDSFRKIYKVLALRKDPGCLVVFHDNE